MGLREGKRFVQGPTEREAESGFESVLTFGNLNQRDSLNIHVLFLYSDLEQLPFNFHSGDLSS